MKIAKLFKNGQSQAVRLPKDFRIDGQEVYVKKVGKTIVLIPKDDPWESLLQSLDQFSKDFMDKRQQPPLQDREKF